MATNPRRITLEDLLKHKERVVRIQAQAILDELEALERQVEVKSRFEHLKEPK